MLLNLKGSWLEILKPIIQDEYNKGQLETPCQLMYVYLSIRPLTMGLYIYMLFSENPNKELIFRPPIIVPFVAALLDL